MGKFSAKGLAERSGLILNYLFKNSDGKELTNNLHDNLVLSNELIRVN